MEVFHNQVAELQMQNPNGGYVVIKGDNILGVWQTRMDALKEGIKAFGNVAFLVKDINENDVVLNFSRNLSFT